MIWRLYLALRKMDRFLHLRMLRKPCVYIIPGKLKDKAKSGISALGNFADIFCVLTHCGFAVKFSGGSAKVTGGPPGLQIRCWALKPSRVGSIPMHFRQFIRKFRFLFNKFL